MGTGRSCFPTESATLDKSFTASAAVPGPGSSLGKNFGEEIAIHTHLAKPARNKKFS